MTGQGSSPVFCFTLAQKWFQTKLAPSSHSSPRIDFALTPPNIHEGGQLSIRKKRCAKKSCEVKGSHLDISPVQ
jgi:hypothetical protein